MSKISRNFNQLEKYLISLVKLACNLCVRCLKSDTNQLSVLIHHQSVHYCLSGYITSEVRRVCVGACERMTVIDLDFA